MVSELFRLLLDPSWFKLGFYLYYISTATEFVSVVAEKSLPVHHYSADCIFLSFGMIGFILSHFENRVLNKPVLGGVASDWS